MVSRSIYFPNQTPTIYPDWQNPGKKKIKIEGILSFFPFKPYLSKPNQSWEVHAVYITFDDSYQDIIDNISKFNYLMIQIKDDKDIYFKDSNGRESGASKDFRIFKNGRIELDLEHISNVEIDNQILKIEGGRYNIIGSLGFDDVLAKTIRIQAIRDLWKLHSNDQTETGTIKGRKIEEVLGDNWQTTFDNKNTAQKIDNNWGILKGKIIKELNKDREKVKTILFTPKRIEKLSLNDRKAKGMRILLEKEFEIDVFDNDDILNHNKKTTIKEIKFFCEKGKADAEEQFSFLTNINNKKFELKFDIEYFHNGGAGRVGTIETGPGWDNLHVYNYHRLDEGWKNGQITLKKIETKPKQKKINELKSQLQNTTDLTQLTQIINEAQELATETNQLDEEIKQAKQKLATDLAKYQKVVQNNIQQALNTNNLDEQSINQSISTLINQLNQTDKLTEIDEIETQILTQIGELCLNNLIIDASLALTQDETNKNLAKEKLIEFKNNNVFYKKSAYQNHKNQVENLILKLDNNDSNQSSEIPWEKIILGSCIGIGLLTLIILLVINLNKNSRRR